MTDRLSANDKINRGIEDIKDGVSRKLKAEAVKTEIAANSFIQGGLNKIHSLGADSAVLVGQTFKDGINTTLDAGESLLSGVQDGYNTFRSALNQPTE